ncbi:hypothetical protein U1Q18_031334, partial [Sarracenia purpurea var. burkii]
RQKETAISFCRTRCRRKSEPFRSIPQGLGTNMKLEIADLSSRKLTGNLPPIHLFLPDESGRGIMGIVEEGTDLSRTIIWCGVNSERVCTKSLNGSHGLKGINMHGDSVY